MGAASFFSGFSAITGTQTIPIELEEGELTDVQVEYTKTSTESGGITLYAYGGEAELTAPQMGALPTSGTAGIIQARYQITFTDPGSGALPDVYLFTKENLQDKVNNNCSLVEQWVSLGAGGRTGSGGTYTWAWNWDTTNESSVHNGPHSLKYEVHWANGSVTTDEGVPPVTVDNLVVNSTPDPGLLLLGNTGTVNISAGISGQVNSLVSSLSLAKISVGTTASAQEQSGGNWSITSSSKTQGIYTYDVTASGTAPNSSTVMTKHYRSEHLTTSISANYEGLDSNGYNYTINYSINDNVNASSGSIIIYKNGTTHVASLGNIDISPGTHSKSLCVDRSWLPGNFTAVLEVCDSHCMDYRDHKNRWALESACAFCPPCAVTLNANPTGIFRNGKTSTITAHLTQGDIAFPSQEIIFSTSGITPEGKLNVDTAITDANGDATVTYTSPDGYGEVTVTGIYTLFPKNPLPSGSGTVTVFDVEMPYEPLWLFNGQTQTNYPSETTLVAHGTQSGIFDWSITAGSDKVKFRSGSNLVDHITVSNDNTATLVAIAKSAAKEDITLKFKWNDIDIISHKTDVRIPKELALNGDPNYNDKPWDTNTTLGLRYGFETTIHYKIRDQLNEAMARKTKNGLISPQVEINEKFTTAFISDMFNETWDLGNWGGGLHDPLDVFDTIRVQAIPSTMYPDPYHPNDTGADTAVDHCTQQIYVGSTTEGSGVLVKQHTLQRYRGKGRHL